MDCADTGLGCWRPPMSSSTMRRRRLKRALVREYQSATLLLTASMGEEGTDVRRHQKLSLSDVLPLSCSIGILSFCHSYTVITTGSQDHGE